MSWPTGLYADSVTTSEPLPNLLGFIADEDKEFQASLAREPRGLWDRIQGFSNQRFVVGSKQDAATERL